MTPFRFSALANISSPGHGGEDLTRPIRVSGSNLAIQARRLSATCGGSARMALNVRQDVLCATFCLGRQRALPVERLG